MKRIEAFHNNPRGLGMSHISNPTSWCILGKRSYKIPKEPDRILNTTMAVSWSTPPPCSESFFLIPYILPGSIYPTNFGRLITFPFGNLTGYALETSWANAITA